MNITTILSSNYILSFFNDMAYRPFFIYQYHTLVVDQVEESSLILLYLLFPIGTVTILFIVQTGIMLRIKEALTVQGARTIEKISFVPGEQSMYDYPIHK